MSHDQHGRVSLADVDAATAESVAEVMQALATPSRVRLLARLCDGPCSVGVLATSVGLEQSLVSHQLRLLRHLGLVTRVRDGRLAVYELHDEHVAVLLAQAVHHVEHAHVYSERREGRASRDAERARSRSSTTSTQSP